MEGKDRKTAVVEDMEARGLSASDSVTGDLGLESVQWFWCKADSPSNKALFGASNRVLRVFTVWSLWFLTRR